MAKLTIIRILILILQFIKQGRTKCTITRSNVGHTVVAANMGTSEEAAVAAVRADAEGEASFAAPAGAPSSGETVALLSPIADMVHTTTETATPTVPDRTVAGDKLDAVAVHVRTAAGVTLGAAAVHTRTAAWVINIFQAVAVASHMPRYARTAKGR